MQTMITGTTMPAAGLEERINTLFQESQDAIHRRTDRLFAGLLLFQWLAAMAAAFWISPRTWIGTTSQIHWHVWAAIFLGGIITSLPVWLAWKQPGRGLTRHAIAAAQMIFSALLIDLTGGRIETHFHIFGSLAFLAFYRDWRVLVTATVVVVADHFVRGVYWPQSLFGTLAPGPWRWLEHSGWVIFEDIFLFISIRQSLGEMFEVATRRAKLEAVNTEIERQVIERTAELTDENAAREKAQLDLRQSQLRQELVFNSIGEGIHWIDQDGRIILENPAAARMLGWEVSDLVGRPAHSTMHHTRADGTPYPQSECPIYAGLRTGAARRVNNEVFWRKDGTSFSVEYTSTPVRGKGGEMMGVVVVFTDTTERKHAERKLDQANEELLDASRRAGMAEVATGILHNVGNVLNSVNVAATCVADSLKKSKAANLSKVVALLREHESDLGDFLTTDAKGKQLPGYLGQLAEHLAREQAGALQELSGLQKNIGHIKDIVTMQQGLAKASGLKEELQMNDLVEDALRMNASSLARHDIQVIKEFQNPPLVTVEKHQVLQILVNLVRNAIQACEASGQLEKKLTLRTTPGKGHVQISVCDNGAGIPPENLTRIFAHGFTTKKDGHGFGLHSAAIAAKEMGGSLTVQSDGLGHGATFTLELPGNENKDSNE